MKVLFLMFHGFSESSGITKKIRGQVKGLEENGLEVDLAYYEFDETGERFWVVGDKPVAFLGKGALGKLRKRIDFSKLQEYIIKQQYDLVYIRSFHNANPFTINLVKNIKNNGSKVVIEIPTFPYDAEYQDWKIKPELFVDKLFRHRLMSEVDAVLTFSEDKEIFGQRTICISNAIDFDAIPLRENHPVNWDEIHLLGVAEIHYWHGFDRLLKGLGEYYQRSPSTNIYFHLVGEYFGTREREEIEGVIAKYNLQDRVIVHGALFGDQLNEVFDRCDFAIGSLGRHRTGIERMRSLKNREYAARGIPFAYAEFDSDFDHQKYVVKYPADESTVNIDLILDYLRNSSISTQEIRDSVQDLSWKNQMRIVISSLFE